MSDLLASEVVAAIRGTVGWVRLNRPHRGNSVTPEVVAAFGAAVSRLDDDDAVRAVVLTGTGKVFCAGADVQAMYDVYRTDGADALTDYLADVWMPAVQRTVRAFWAARKPLVAAVNGAATAGGLDFSLCCDLRVATTSARFAESYVNLGMVPVAGGAYLLPRTVGAATALDLMSAGRIIDATEAERVRLVDRVCAPEQLDSTAQAVAESLTTGPAATTAELKRIARGSSAAELHSALDESYRANVELIRRDDVRERILAVMQRFSSKG